MANTRFFVLTTENETEKASRMRLRCERLGIAATFVVSPGCCMLGHLSMLEAFLQDPEADFAVMCEDDVHLRGCLKEALPRLAERLAVVDVLLLGYLLTYAAGGRVVDELKVPELRGGEAAEMLRLSLREFEGDHIWGTQMYMVGRTYARFILDNYGRSYGENPGAFPYWSADHIITKMGRALLVTPMLGVEEISYHEHPGQHIFHTDSHNFNYDASLYV